MMRARTLLGIGVALVSVPLAARAQQPAKRPPRSGQTIEIRGQVPTPQVVTVRPREVPAYSRQVLSPGYYDGSFWPSILPAYQMVPSRQVTGAAPLDTTAEGLARGGATAAQDAAMGIPAPTAADSQRALAGTSAAEIQAMRQQLARRRARLDSLEQAERAAAATRLSRQRAEADSVARAQEIDAIRRELEVRRQRLDSLENVIKSMGRPKKAPTVAVPADTTRPPATPPRTRR
jgi:hypothetical protein